MGLLILLMFIGGIIKGLEDQWQGLPSSGKPSAVHFIIAHTQLVFLWLVAGGVSSFANPACCWSGHDHHQGTISRNCSKNRRTPHIKTQSRRRTVFRPLA
jgi:hypothetical protein